MKTCNNIDVKGKINTIKALVMGLVYGETEIEEFDTIACIGDTLDDLEDTVARIEAECERQKEQAKKLRIMCGNQLNDMCDAAGIK